MYKYSLKMSDDHVVTATADPVYEEIIKLYRSLSDKVERELVDKMPTKAKENLLIQLVESLLEQSESTEYSDMMVSIKMTVSKL